MCSLSFDNVGLGDYGVGGSVEVVVLFIQLKKIHILPICKRPEPSKLIVSTVDHLEIRWETTWSGHIIDHMVGMR